MPMADAISLVIRSFDEYEQERKEMLKRTEFIPPTRNTLYLLNLLADNRFLTVDELCNVMEYLEDRHDRLVEAEGGIPPKKKAAMQERQKEQRLRDELAAAKQEAIIAQNVLEVLRKEQKSLLSSLPARAMYTVMPSSSEPRSAAAHPGLAAAAGDSRSVAAATATATASSAAAAAAPRPSAQVTNVMSAGLQIPISVASILSNKSFNFNSPNVKQALDNLISGDPNILKNISDTLQQQQQQQQQLNTMAQQYQQQRAPMQMVRAQYEPRGMGMQMGLQGQGMPPRGGPPMRDNNDQMSGNQGSSENKYSDWRNVGNAVP